MSVVKTIKRGELLRHSYVPPEGSRGHSLRKASDDDADFEWGPGQWYDTTPAETAAGVTPVNFTYPPGDVRRYGAVGDGSTNDTDALQDAVDTNAEVYIHPSLTLAITQVDVDSVTKIYGGGTIKATVKNNSNGQPGILNCTARVEIEGLNLDMNELGQAGITIAGDGSVCRNVYGYDFTGDDISPSGESRGLFIVTASNCQFYNTKATNLLAGTATNISAGRVFGIQNNSENHIISGVWCDTVSDVVVTVCKRLYVSNVYAKNVSDNAFYILNGSEDITIDGGIIYGVAEPVVNAGERIVFRNFEIINPTIAIGVQDADDFTVENVHTRIDSNYADDGTNFFGTRSGNTASSKIKIINCTCDLPHTFKVLELSIGTVDDVTIRNCKFTTRWTASSSNKIILDYDEGDRFDIQDNVFEIVDETGALTSSDIFVFDYPDVTERSYWKRNRIKCVGSHIARVSGQTTAGTTNPLLEIDDAMIQVNLGPYIRDEGFATTATKIAWSTQAPAAGTWSVGDVVWNSGVALGEPRGWICTTGGTPGTWSAFGQIGVRSGAGSPSGSVTPFFVGEVYLNTTGPQLFMSTGTSNTNWLQIG